MANYVDVSVTQHTKLNFKIYTQEGTHFSSAETLQNVRGLEVGTGEWKRDW
jgi:hypothetical protein